VGTGETVSPGDDQRVARVEGTFTGSKLARLPMAPTRARRYYDRMKIRDMMTKGAHSASPDTLVTEVAAVMRLHDIGVVPVIENGRIVGMLTDRDIVLQVVAEGADPNTKRVRDVMSVGSISIFDDQDVNEAVALMQQYQVRRLPVLDRNKAVVGIVSLGDLAVDVNAGLSGQVLKEVSEPAMPLP
jgi:CBS domain-containing protein